MASRFGSAKKQEQWKARLIGRTRKPGEPIQKLADDIWCMVQKAYPRMDLAAKEVLAFDAFRNAVGPGLKIKLFDRGCSTIDEAVMTIEQYEAVRESIKDNRSYARGVENYTANQNETSYVGQILSQILEKLDSRERRTEHSDADLGGTQECPIPSNEGSVRHDTNVATGRRSLGDVICYGCNNPGHVRKNCPMRRNSQDIVCFECRNVGHIRRNCPYRRHGPSRHEETLAPNNYGQKWSGNGHPPAY